MTIPTFAFNLLAFVIVVVGATVHGCVGFGMGLVAAPVLLLINPIYVPGPLLVCSLILTVMMTLRERQSVDFYGLGWGYTGRVFGTIIAVTILSFLPSPFVSIVTASMILLAVILSILKLRTRLTLATLLTAGFASGIMSTLSAVGGPPLALLYQYEDGARIRATMSGFFILGTTTSLVGLTIAGKFTNSHLLASGILIPAVLLGFVLSTYVIRGQNFKNSRTAVLLVSTISSIVVIIRAFFL